MLVKQCRALSIPNHPELLLALGRLAIAHTHLELILRFTVKTLCQMEVERGLNATRKVLISKVREKIKKLFTEKRPLESQKTLLDALLAEAELLTKQRNDFLHLAWSETVAGHALLHTENYQWKEAPAKEAVDEVTQRILKLANEINDARLHGFISQVVIRHKQGAKKIQC